MSANWLDQVPADVAWQPYVPTEADAWDLAKVGHLYRRAGCGASWPELQEGLALGPAALIDKLLRGEARGPAADADASLGSVRDVLIDRGTADEIKAFWMYRLLHGPDPLRERLALFWHNHFATSNAKVGDPGLMLRQYETLQQGALGEFGTLLQQMTRDPAMLLWLDSQQNVRGRPNENYARELMELFSLGLGNYAEHDVQEAARALTGWEVRDRQANFRAEQFDDGVKTVLGRAGAWRAPDVVNLCLEQPACAEFIARKLFRELITDQAVPSAGLMAPLVERFRGTGLNVGALVDTILRSRLFFSAAARKQRIKSPVELVTGIARALEGRVSPAHAVQACDRLGQSLFFPPSVKGWEGGSAWLNSSTVLWRQNLAFDATRGIGPVTRLDPANLVEKHGVHGAESVARFFMRLFLQVDDDRVQAAICERLEDERRRPAPNIGRPDLDAQMARTAAHLVLTLPEYQLA